MATTSFTLRDPKAVKKTSIILTFTYAKERLRISTGESISPKHWNPKSESVREMEAEPNALVINSKLSALKTNLESVFIDFVKNGITPTTKELQEALEKKRNLKNKPLNVKSFWVHFDDFIEFKRNELPDVRDYDKSLRKHLKKVEEKYGKQLTFSLFKVKHNGVVDVMKDYLTYDAENTNGEKGLKVNTIGKQFKNLKVFLNWCFDMEIFPRFPLSHMATLTEDVEDVYLTREEVDSIEKLNDLTEMEKTIRDLFLIGIDTGFRFSDFKNLENAQIIDDILSIIPQKTKNSIGKKVNVPIGRRFREVLQRRDGKMPIFKGKIVKFNETLRTLAKKAEINDKIVIETRIAGKNQKKIFEKWQLVSSHTCRRSFCTQKFLEGMPSEAIMTFSGHKQHKNFMRYLKIDNKVVIEKYKSFFG
jgi:integrase